MSGHHITVMCPPLMKSSQSIVFEWFSEAISGSSLVQCRACYETKSTSPAGGLCKKNASLSFHLRPCPCTVYTCVWVHACVSMREGETEREGECVFVCKCSISGSTLAPSQRVQTLRLRTLRGHKWHEAKNNIIIFTAYLPLSRNSPMLSLCHFSSF